MPKIKYYDKPKHKDGFFRKALQLPVNAVDDPWKLVKGLAYLPKSVVDAYRSPEAASAFLEGMKESFKPYTSAARGDFKPLLEYAYNDPLLLLLDATAVGGVATKGAKVAAKSSMLSKGSRASAAKLAGYKKLPKSMQKVLEDSPESEWGSVLPQFSEGLRTAEYVTQPDLIRIGDDLHARRSTRTSKAYSRVDNERFKDVKPSDRGHTIDLQKSMRMSENPIGDLDTNTRMLSESPDLFQQRGRSEGLSGVFGDWWDRTNLRPESMRFNRQASKSVIRRRNEASRLNKDSQLQADNVNAQIGKLISDHPESFKIDNHNQFAQDVLFNDLFKNVRRDRLGVESVKDRGKLSDVLKKMVSDDLDSLPVLKDSSVDKRLVDRIGADAYIPESNPRVFNRRSGDTVRSVKYSDALMSDLKKGEGGTKQGQLRVEGASPIVRELREAAVKAQRDLDDYVGLVADDLPSGYSLSRTTTGGGKAFMLGHSKRKNLPDRESLLDPNLRMVESRFVPNSKEKGVVSPDSTILAKEVNDRIGILQQEAEQANQIFLAAADAEVAPLQSGKGLEGYRKAKSDTRQSGLYHRVKRLQDTKIDDTFNGIADQIIEKMQSEPVKELQARASLLNDITKAVDPKHTTGIPKQLLDTDEYIPSLPQKQRGLFSDKRPAEAPRNPLKASGDITRNDAENLFKTGNQEMLADAFSSDIGRNTRILADAASSRDLLVQSPRIHRKSISSFGKERAVSVDEYVTGQRKAKNIWVDPNDSSLKLNRSSIENGISELKKQGDPTRSLEDLLRMQDVIDDAALKDEVFLVDSKLWDAYADQLANLADPTMFEKSIGVLKNAVLIGRLPEWTVRNAVGVWLMLGIEGGLGRGVAAMVAANKGAMRNKLNHAFGGLLDEQTGSSQMLIDAAETNTTGHAIKGVRNKYSRFAQAAHKFNNAITDMPAKRARLLQLIEDQAKLDNDNRIALNKEPIPFSDAVFDEIINDPVKVDLIGQKMLMNMIDYSDVSKAERKWARRSLPLFWSYLKGATKAGASSAANNPIKWSVAGKSGMMLSREGEETSSAGEKAALENMNLPGGLVYNMKGLVPYDPMYTPGLYLKSMLGDGSAYTSYEENPTSAGGPVWSALAKLVANTDPNTGGKVSGNRLQEALGDLFGVPPITTLSTGATLATGKQIPLNRAYSDRSQYENDLELFLLNSLVGTNIRRPKK